MGQKSLNLPPNSTKFMFFATTKKLGIDVERPNFSTNANAESIREMVMENQEMVMEKSWETIL